MIKAIATGRLGVLGGVLGMAMATAGCRDAAKEGTGTGATASSGAAPASVAAGGSHASEEFCKTMVFQFEQMTKLDVSNVQKRDAYFAGQKELNLKLVKTAPASLASDTAMVTRASNAVIDAQLARDVPKVKAASAVVTSPEHMAAARRMNDYCGTSATTAR